MKKVAFDARLWAHPGIGRYMRSLFRMMLSLGARYEFVLAGDPRELAEFRDAGRVTVRPCGVPIYSLREQVEMRRYLSGADLVHVPHFNAPWFLRGKLVVTIHDLTYFKVAGYEPFPGARFFLKALLGRIARRADRIIAVSRATRADCEALFPAMKGKMTVIYEAADPMFSDGGPAAPDVRGRFGLSKPYILSVGSIREHKNIQGLLAAYERMMERTPTDADLVLCGQIDPRFEKKYGLAERIRRNPRIRFISGADDEALRGLYRHASVFAMPSFYEGFGLPAVEAMASGVPVVVSERTSLGEIVGTGGLTFDPAQIDRLAELLYNVLSDKDLHRKLAQKGRIRAQDFSWQKAAAETLQVYDEVLSDHRAS